jgi:hypothetical protein
MQCNALFTLSFFILGKTEEFNYLIASLWQGVPHTILVIHHLATLDEEK